MAYRLAIRHIRWPFNNSTRLKKKRIHGRILFFFCIFAEDFKRDNDITVKKTHLLLTITLLSVTVGLFPLCGQELAKLTEIISRKEQLTNLPTFYITTSETISSRDVSVAGKLLVAATTNLSGKYNDSIDIRGRGNSTWFAEKKPYRIKLFKKSNLLGMPANDKSWAVLANYIDKSLVRNALGFEVSKLCDVYFTPSYRYIDLVINKEYLGNYLITDQVEVSGDRVHITKQTPSDTTLPAIEGGYLIELDGYADLNTVAEGALFPEGFKSVNGTPVTIKYPKDDEINQQQREYIITSFNKFETLILNFKQSDPIDTLEKYLDIDAMVNWYIASELSSNPDFLWSTYLMKERGTKRFTFGPLWDYDQAFNNDSRVGDTRKKLMLFSAHEMGSLRKGLLNLFAIPAINEKVRNRWLEIRKKDPEERLTYCVDSIQRLITASQNLNFEKWQILGNTTNATEIASIRRYVTDHVAALDSLFGIFFELTGKFEINENNWYTLLNVANDKALDLKDSLPESLTPTVLWTDRDGRKESQLFRFTKLANNTYILTNKLSDKVLEAYVKTDDGGVPSKVPGHYKLCINTYREGNKSQLWQLTEKNYDKFLLTNVYSGMAIENLYGKTSDGNIINMFSIKTNSMDQLWKFKDYSSVNTDTQEELISNQNAEIYSTPGRLHILCQSKAELLISNMIGQIIIQQTMTNTFTEVSLQRGLYVIQIGNTTYKVAIP